MLQNIHKNTGIYNSTTNVYLPSFNQINHSIMLDLGQFSVCICTVTNYASTCLPNSIDFDFRCICSDSNMQRFKMKCNPSYVKPINFILNYLAHLSLTIFIRRQQKVIVSSCIFHFDSNNARHLILLLLLSGQIKMNPGPIKSHCGIRENEIDRNDETINCDKCQFWCHIQ